MTLPLIDHKGPLAPLGVPDQDYDTVKSSDGTFIMNALVYRLDVAIMSSDDIRDLVRKNPRKVVVSQCNLVQGERDLYSLLFAVVCDDYRLDMWDWDYGRPHVGAARNPYRP